MPTCGLGSDKFPGLKRNSLESVRIRFVPAALAAGLFRFVPKAAGRNFQAHKHKIPAKFKQCSGPAANKGTVPAARRGRRALTVADSRR